MRISIKKIMVTAGIIGIMMTSTVFADNTELINSTGSVSTDTTVGEDVTQGKRTTYGDESITTSTHESESSVMVYATKASFVQYSIPQVIIGDGTEGTASYKIGVKGDLTSTQRVVITAPTEFTLTDGARNVNATIAQPQGVWTYENLDTEDFNEITGSISFKIPAGSFNGSFKFTIELTR